MVGDLFIVGIPGLSNTFKGPGGQDLCGKLLTGFKPGQALEIAMDFLCHSGRKHSGICSRIRDQFFLVKFLHRLQCLIRADFKHSGTVILQLCQII